MTVSALVIACVLGLQHILSEQYMPLPFSVTLPALLIPHLAVVGVLEGLYTALGRSILKKITGDISA